MVMMETPREKERGVVYERAADPRTSSLSSSRSRGVGGEGGALTWSVQEWLAVRDHLTYVLLALQQQEEEEDPAESPSTSSQGEVVTEEGEEGERARRGTASSTDEWPAEEEEAADVAVTHWLQKQQHMVRRSWWDDGRYLSFSATRATETKRDAAAAPPGRRGDACAPTRRPRIDGVVPIKSFLIWCTHDLPQRNRPETTTTTTTAYSYYIPTTDVMRCLRYFSLYPEYFDVVHGRGLTVGYILTSGQMNV